MIFHTTKVKLDPFLSLANTTELLLSLRLAEFHYFVNQTGRRIDQSSMAQVCVWQVE